MDVQTLWSKEEFVLSMGQRNRGALRLAVMKDAQSMFRRRDYVEDITSRSTANPMKKHVRSDEETCSVVAV